MERVLVEYITSLEKQDKSPKTIISYQNGILIFMNDLHIKPDHFVKATDVAYLSQKVFAEKVGETMSPDSKDVEGFE